MADRNILEARVRLEPVPAHSGLVLAHFADLEACLRAVAPQDCLVALDVQRLRGAILRRLLFDDTPEAQE